MSPGVSSGNTLDDIRLKLHEPTQEPENKDKDHLTKTSKEQQKMGDHSPVQSSSESKLKPTRNREESDIPSTNKPSPGKNRNRIGKFFVAKFKGGCLIFQ